VRIAVAGALVALAALADATTAAAGDGQFADARAQVATARALVDRSLEQAKAGDRRAAYDTARTAYLDHFERAEVPLRLRDANLVLDTEFAFAKLRNGIRDGNGIGELTATSATIRRHLDDVDRTLGDPGFAGRALAFGFSFAILFREGLEAVILIAILLGSLQAGRASNFRRPLGLGVLAAVAATVVTWVIATLVLDLAPVGRELLEGVTALAAVGVLFLVTFWLVARLDRRRRMEFMRARVATAVATGSAVAFAGLGFTAVYREGFETVLFYQALQVYARGLELWLVLGVVAAAAALGVVGYAVLGLGKRLPVKPMLMTGALVLLLLSVAFAGNAVRSLQEGDMLPVTPVDSGWARLPVFAAELTGIHPTREGLMAQVLLLTLYAAGAAALVVRYGARRRATVEAQAS
jgi:high-affinity iron transporter